MPEPEIVRTEVITPESVVGDNYGNIIVKTTTGAEVKVNKKHEGLHQLFYDATEEGRALKIGYAVYMNREYVHTSELFDGKPPVEKQVKPITAGVGKTEAMNDMMNRVNRIYEMTPDKWADKDRITRESIEAQVAMKCLTDLTIAGIKLSDVPDLLHRAIESRLRPFVDISSHTPPTKPLQSKSSPVKKEESSSTAPTRDLTTIKSLGELHKAIFDDFGIQPPESLKLLGKEKWADMDASFTDCYLAIQSIKG